MSILKTLKERFPQLEGGLKSGELSVIATPAHLPMHNGTFASLLRSKRLEAISREISDDPRIHKRMAEDAVQMNRKTYEFLIGSPELYPYYVHNIFRDMFDIEKLYDYEEPPITKVNVPDLLMASACIENFKFVMADQAVKLPYKINKTVNLKDGKTEVIVELILLED